MNSYQFFIGNIHCASCISTIEKQLNKSSKELGIKNFSLSLVDKNLFTSAKTNSATIINNSEKNWLPS